MVWCCVLFSLFFLFVFHHITALFWRIVAFFLCVFSSLLLCCFVNIFVTAVLLLGDLGM